MRESFLGWRVCSRHLFSGSIISGNDVFPGLRVKSEKVMNTAGRLQGWFVY